MRALAAVLLTLVATVAIAIAYVAITGLSARTTPGVVETAIARTARKFAVPRDLRGRENPVADDAQTVQAGMAHFADHCAGCHGNDGRGESTMGRGLSPRPPDMRQPATQQLTDGELFAIIENGVRFTGMPAFGDGTPDGERGSWQLVRFIRHLPDMRDPELEQMKARNPQPPDDIRRQIKEEEFLEGKD